MEPILTLIVGCVLLMSVVHSFVWFSRTDMTRLSISGIYFCVAVFSVLRLLQMLHFFAGGDGTGEIFRPMIVLMPLWLALFAFNVMMSLCLIKIKRNGKNGE